VVLHRSFAQAVCWGWIPRNPVSAANRPEVARTVIVPPTPEQVRMLLRSAERADQELACWLHVAVATGARRGEICALRWGDIDWERATVRIERSVSVTKQAGVTSSRQDRRSATRVDNQAVGSGVAVPSGPRQWEGCRVPPPVGRDDQVFTGTPSRQPIRPELITRRWSAYGRRTISIMSVFTTSAILWPPNCKFHRRGRPQYRLASARPTPYLYHFDIYWAFVPARDRDAADHLETVIGSA